jgi:hypothetical protein
VKYQREQRRSKPLCGTLPGQTVSRFFIEGDNHLVQLLFLYMSRKNVFVSDCEEEEKRKKTKLRFFLTKQRETNIIFSQLSEDLPLIFLFILVYRYLMINHDV